MQECKRVTLVCVFRIRGPYYSLQSVRALQPPFYEVQNFYASFKEYLTAWFRVITDDKRWKPKFVVDALAYATLTIQLEGEPPDEEEGWHHFLSAIGFDDSITYRDKTKNSAVLRHFAVKVPWLHICVEALLGLLGSRPIELYAKLEYKEPEDPFKGEILDSDIRRIRLESMKPLQQVRDHLVQNRIETIDLWRLRTSARTWVNFHPDALDYFDYLAGKHKILPDQLAVFNLTVKLTRPFGPAAQRNWIECTRTRDEAGLRTWVDPEHNRFTVCVDSVQDVFGPDTQADTFWLKVEPVVQVESEKS